MALRWPVIVPPRTPPPVPVPVPVPTPTLPMMMRDTVGVPLRATPFVGPVMPVLAPPKPTTTLPGLGATSGASSPVIINVTVAADAVQIRAGNGKADSAQKDYGTKVGEAIADALAKFARAEMSVTPGTPALAAGARS